MANLLKQHQHWIIRHQASLGNDVSRSAARFSPPHLHNYNRWLRYDVCVQRFGVTKFLFDFQATKSTQRKNETAKSSCYMFQSSDHICSKSTQVHVWPKPLHTQAIQVYFLIAKPLPPLRRSIIIVVIGPTHVLSSCDSFSPHSLIDSYAGRIPFFFPMLEATLS